MISLRLVQRGEGARALVLIHAFPLSSKMYDQVVELLAATFPALSIILIDLPGFGDAPLMPHWTMDLAMKDLREKLQALSISSVILGGTSMGGYAVFAYYKLFPADCEALILSNTKAEADDEKAKQGREDYAKEVENRGAIVAIEKQLDKLIGATTKAEHPELYERVKQSILATDPNAIAAALRAMAQREDSVEMLSGIDCPALVLWSEEDELMSEAITENIAAKIENSTYESIPSTGHLSPLEAPVEWTQIVTDFLTYGII